MQNGYLANVQHMSVTQLIYDELMRIIAWSNKFKKVDQCPLSVSVLKVCAWGSNPFRI